MGSQGVILNFVQSCVGGKLGFADCSPLWQFGGILAFIVLLSAALIVLRLRSRSDSAEKS